MSASPALWTARVILVAALGLGVGLVVARHARPDPAVAVPPAERAGASYPVPVGRPTPVMAAAKPAPAPSPTPPAYTVRRVLDTGGPIRYGAWFWDEAGVPPGEEIITVDLKANVLSIFRGGYEIGTAAIIYGADEKPTPLGVFPITQKDAHHVSNLYGAPMPYALRLTQDGVFIHASKVAYDAASHGCVGVPLAFAKKLFAAVRVGDRVIITRGETLGQGGAIKAAG